MKIAYSVALRTSSASCRSSDPGLGSGVTGCEHMARTRSRRRLVAGYPTAERAAARSARSGVEIEVARRLLLEPEAVVLRRLLEEVRRLLERVLLGLRLGLGLVVEAPLVGLGGRGPDRPDGLVGLGVERAAGGRWRRRLDLLGGEGGVDVVEPGGILGSELVLGREGVEILVRHRSAIFGDGWGVPAVAADGPEGLGLLAGDFGGIGTSSPLELEVFANGVVEQAHARSLPRASHDTEVPGPAHRPILPRVLGLVERLVGAGHQLVLGGSDGARDAQGRGDLEDPVAVEPGHLELLDLAAHALAGEV